MQEENAVIDTAQPADAAAEMVQSGAEVPATPTGKSESETETTKPAKPAEWVQKRIDALTREKHEERRAREALEAQLASLQQQIPENAQDAVPRNEVERLAHELVKKQSFDRTCNDVYEKGSQEFKDFDDVIGNFRLLGGMPTEFLEAVTQLPDAHKVLYQLGSNPEEASRILGLPPIQMAVKLAEIATKAAPVRAVSKAPSPVEPIDTGGSTDELRLDDSNLSMADWMKARQSQLKR